MCEACLLGLPCVSAGGPRAACVFAAVGQELHVEPTRWENLNELGATLACVFSLGVRGPCSIDLSGPFPEAPGVSAGVSGPACVFAAGLGVRWFEEGGVVLTGIRGRKPKY